MTVSKFATSAGVNQEVKKVLHFLKKSYSFTFILKGFANFDLVELSKFILILEMGKTTIRAGETDRNMNDQKTEQNSFDLLYHNRND